MLEQIFKAMLITSLIGTALAALLAVFKPFTKKFFSSRWHYYMWLVVLVVMVLPVRFSLPAKTEVVTAPSAAYEMSEMPMDSGLTVQGGAPKAETIHEETAQPKQFETLTALAKGGFGYLSWIWLLGVVLLALTKIIGYLVFLHRLRRGSEVISCPELSAFTDKKIVTRVSGDICSPLLTGLIKTTLLLPKTQITKGELHHVLAHEMTHFKRKDIWAKWFLAIVKCIHWFNPAIYWISREIHLECEISCDLAVVEGMSREEKKGYIDTILMLLSAKNAKAIPLTTGMTGNKRTLKRRFMMMKNKPKLRKKTVILSVVLAVFAVFGAVLASGLASGKFLKPDGSDLLTLETDERGEGAFNFLVLGLDQGGHADTVALVSFGEEGIESLMSIPRNVRFDEKTVSELLAEENGRQKAVDALREKLSVPISYYAEVELDAIEEAVDILGAVEFDVPQDMSYIDPHQNLSIDLKVGRQSLNGEQALGLLRFRGYKDGDMSRMATIQSFVKELVRQKATPENLDKVPELYKIISENVRTNYPSEALSKDIKTLEGIKEREIECYTLPGSIQVTENGTAAYEIDFSEAEGILERFSGE